MKNYRMTGIHLLVLFSFMIALAGSLQAQLSERAPDVLPGTLPEMREPSYWIAKMNNPDEVLLKRSEILDQNKRFIEKVSTPGFFVNIPEERQSKLQHYFPGISLYPFDIDALAQSDWPDTVRFHMAIEKEYLTGQDFGNANGVKYSGREIQSLIDEMAKDGIGDMKMRYALSVRSTRLKNVPAFSPRFIGLVKSKDKTRFDLWSIGLVKIARPLLVLHMSKSGEFAFVRCDIGHGWVRAEDIAFCEKDELKKFTKNPDFVVCTGERIQLYTDESSTVSTGWLRMGDRLPYASSSNSRQLLIPIRRTDGSLSEGVAWLAIDADVSAGYLPYTRRNIITTAFKLLDEPYDFTGTFFGRMHESTYRDIFACFGFVLPYHGGMFTHYGSDSYVLDTEVGTKGQYHHISGREPFVTVIITLQERGGHALLLLGVHEGVPIVFDQHGYGYKDKDGNEVIIQRCCVDDITMPAYFLKRNLTFLVLR